MSARDAHQAVNRYVQTLQSALHCITPAKLWRGSTEVNVNHVLVFDRSLYVELRRQNPDDGQRYEPIYLSLLIGYRIISNPGNPPRVVTVSYQFAISNRQHQEILAFHWHPEGISDVREPHMHVGAGIVDAGKGDFGKGFSNFHIPTGHVALPHVVRFLLTDFNVVPNRRDWEAALSRLI